MQLPGDEKMKELKHQRQLRAVGYLPASAFRWLYRVTLLQSLITRCTNFCSVPIFSYQWAEARSPGTQII